MSLTARLIAIGLLVLAISAGCWKVYHAIDSRGYQRAKAEDKAAADAQAARNREMQRAAELRYTVAAEARDRYIIETVTEVRHAAESLAACPVPDRLRGLLNDAAACARGDPASACGADRPLPVAR